MWFVVALFLIGVIVVLQRAVEIRHNHRTMVSLQSHESDFKRAVEDFDSLGAGGWYISDRQYREWKSKYVHLAESVDRVWLTSQRMKSEAVLYADFIDRYDIGRALFVDRLNEDFVRQEVPIIKRILDSKNIQNNEDQVNAIASDEDNTLLVAGAGTGKTTTILGKLAYLLERANVKPREILLLSFTGRAVRELSSRIEQKFPGVDLKAQTFHSFGLSVIGSVLGSKPDIAFASSYEKSVFLNEQFSILLEDTSYLQLAIHYFAYYFKPVVLEPGFSSLDDYYHFVKTQQNVSLKKEIMKSQQEVMIANFLYLNGIEYEYERPYEHKTSDSVFKQYRPDFYLPEYRAYLEHFGINRNGRTRFTSDEAQNAIHTLKYAKQMDWKRALHRQYDTRLIETYSYEFTERDWQDRLTEKLLACGVRFAPLESKEVFDSIANPVTIRQITDLFSTFLDLSKSSGHTLTILNERVRARGNVREEAFMVLFAPILSAYESYLEKTRTIDFHNMLIRAAEYIRDGKFGIDLKYIIIDEFQDFSKSKYFLIKALCDRSPNVKLFCVGDDWQSIFRFSGSDISLMTEFEEAYGFTRRNQLVVTNRFNDTLAVVTNRFILKNPQQIRKEVRARQLAQTESVEIRYTRNRSDVDSLIREILGTLNMESVAENRKATVFILGRYKHNEPEGLGRYRREYENLTIEFLTIHASKGSEADYVIIMDVISGKYGFPTGVNDDPLLEIVLSKGETYPNAEERRLMYVAMTRARRTVYIMTEDRNKSVFVMELEGAKHADETIARCRECGGRMIRRKGPYGEFFGCINFPDCDYKMKA